jgi:hypothetical protein
VVGRVISGAFDVYGTAFPLLIGVAAALVVPFQGALMALQLAAPDTTDAQNGALVIGGLGTVLLILPLVTVVALRVAEARERGTRLDPRTPLQEGVELLPAIFGTQLVVVLAIAALPGLVILLGASTGSDALVGGGFAALLVSAVVNGVRMCLALPVLLLEGPRYATAIRRSAALVRGGWLPTFLSVLAVVGVVLLLEAIAVATAAVTIQSKSEAAEVVAERVAAAITTILAAPFAALATLLIYRERVAAQAGTPG